MTTTTNDVCVAFDCLDKMPQLLRQKEEDSARRLRDLEREVEIAQQRTDEANKRAYGFGARLLAELGSSQRSKEELAASYERTADLLSQAARQRADNVKVLQENAALKDEAETLRQQLACLAERVQQVFANVGGVLCR